MTAQPFDWSEKYTEVGRVLMKVSAVQFGLGTLRLPLTGCHSLTGG